MRIQSVLCAALMLLFPAVLPAATKINEPTAFLTSLYAQMMAATPAKPYSPPDDIYTPHLASLIALDQHDAGGEVGRLEFDIFSNAQDTQISSLKISSKAVENGADRKIVIAQFKNFGKPERLYFFFQKTKTGWLLDDVESRGQTKWTLSVVLKYGWTEEP